MKVGLVIDDSLDRNDGVQQYVRTLGAWLATQGHVVHYLAGQTKLSDQHIHSLSRNVSIRFNGNRLSIPLSAKTRVVKELLARESYDILHVQMPYSPFMAGKIIKNASSSTAVVGTFHILPLGRLQRYANKALAVAQKHALKRFDAICSVSSPAQRFAQSYYGIPSKVIPNMIDIKSWQTSAKPKSHRIVFLGRLVPRKGCEQLLEAVTSLPPQLREKLEIIIAGSGPSREKLEKIAQSHKLHCVKFIGYIDEKDKVDLLASAKLAVFPSLGGESFGIVLIEAMAAGAGVVVGGNNQGYMSVLSEWPETIVDPKDTRNFSEALVRLLKDKDLYERLHLSQQTAVKQYDVHTVGAQVQSLYKEALLHRRREMR